MRSLPTRRSVEHPYPSADLDKPWPIAGGRGRSRTQRKPLYAQQDVGSRLLRDELQGILDSVLTDLERDVVHCIVDERLSLQATADRLGFRAKSYIYRIKTRAFGKLRDAIEHNPNLMEDLNG